MYALQNIYLFNTHQLLKITLDFAQLNKVTLMVYGGAQSGVWGILALKYLPGLRVCAIEANPNVYVLYYLKLSKVFSNYILAALSEKAGLASLFIPPDLDRQSLNFFGKLDKKIFSKYHENGQRAREGWRTDASLYADMGEQDSRIVVPKLELKEFLSKHDETLLFLDIQGEDFNVLAKLETLHFSRIRMIYVEYDRVNEHSDRRLSYELFMSRVEELGFVYFGNDSLENKTAFNMLFLRREDIQLIDPINFPNADFSFNLENLQEKSIVSKLRVARVPFYTLIARLISIFGIDVHKNRNI